MDEIVNDPAAKKINFRSYLAVSYDSISGKGLSEYLQTVKNNLSQAALNVNFTNENDITINNMPARAAEAELTQQGVDFKILMVAIKGQNDDVWIISFSTAKNDWAKYEKTFSDIANSFVLKK